MTSNLAISRLLCLATDVEQYSRLDTPQQECAQADLLAILDRAAARAGIDRSRWVRQAQGDQEFAVLPPDTHESVIVGDFVRHLAGCLAERNANVPTRDRLRLRMAVHVGVARPAALGHAGQTPIAVARLLDAPVLKRVLARTLTTDLVVIVSDSLYQDVVRLRERGLDPAQYTRIPVRAKEYDGHGWVHVPEHRPAELRGFEPEEDPAEQPRAADTADRRGTRPEPERPGSHSSGAGTHVHRIKDVGGVTFGAGSHAAHNITINGRD
ncbi:hypothetical protein [Embleya sp. NPDC005971]|uniref:hypothetical protein n=1 Tax=unclassified Embleya TaxID=2699296 RepID=UPI0033CE868E